MSTPWSVARAADDDETPAAKTDTPTTPPGATTPPPIDVPQADDSDRPRDKSLLGKGPVDDARKGQAVDEAPFYQKWQFWAITGAVVVGVVGLVWGGATLLHALGGGDVRPCSKSSYVECFGQGEPR